MTTQLTTETKFERRRAQVRVATRAVDLFVDGLFGETLHELRVKSHWPMAYNDPDARRAAIAPRGRPEDLAEEPGAPTVGACGVDLAGSHVEMELLVLAGRHGAMDPPGSAALA